MSLLAHQLGDALDHARLVHLVGDLGDDDRLAVLADLLDRRVLPRMMIEPRPSA